MIDRLGWLHVSDFHFIAHGDDFSQRVAGGSLLDDVGSRVAGREPLSFVLVTGDVGFSGKQEEYDVATSFLMRLTSVVGVPPERFFFVAGNHDVDRSKQRLAYSGAFHELTSEAEVDRVLGSPHDLAPLVDRQAAFRAFVDAFTGTQERVPTDDGLAYVAPMVLGGLRMCILGLNSAWLSGRDSEEMKLLVGERQIINVLELARTFSPHVQIAMVHHPLTWLQEWDQLSCQQRLLSQVHFFHRGHLHVAEVALSSSPERPCLSIAAGSGHSTRFFENSYNLVEWDLGQGACTVRSFRYDPSATCYQPGGRADASVVLTGSLPGTQEELVDSMATNVPSAALFAEYLGALLSGQKAEIPVWTGAAVEFRMPGLAEMISSEEMTAATDFLKLRNLLRLYDADVPLTERITEHTAAIEAFAAYLAGVAKRDSHCAERLAGHSIRSLRHETGSSATRLPRAAEFLAALRLESDWALLEVQAARFVDSPDPTLARAAKAALVEAFMHSDEGEKRREAVRLAADLIASPVASAADYLLAAASSEVAGDNAAAIDLAIRALANWPKNSDLQSYARSLALRAGDTRLKAAAAAAAAEGEP